MLCFDSTVGFPVSVPVLTQRMGHAVRATPSPEVTEPFCRLPLPTFSRGTRGSSPWRPAADYGTACPRGRTIFEVVTCSSLSWCFTDCRSFQKPGRRWRSSTAETTSLDKPLSMVCAVLARQADTCRVSRQCVHDTCRRDCVTAMPSRRHTAQSRAGHIWEGWQGGIRPSEQPPPFNATQTLHTGTMRRHWGGVARTAVGMLTDFPFGCARLSPVPQGRVTHVYTQSTWNPSPHQSKRVYFYSCYYHQDQRHARLHAPSRTALQRHARACLLVDVGQSRAPPCRRPIFM